ncbi:MAG: hypothetical protein QXO52_05325 [Thermosphaera sp.]
MARLEGLKRLVEDYMRQVSPGLYYSLESACLKNKGKTCIELLVENPAELREILERKYGSNSSIRIVSRLIIYPIVSRFKGDGIVDDYLNLFLENPSEFKRRVKEFFS